MSTSMSWTAMAPQDEYAKARAYLDQFFNSSRSQTSCLSVLPHDLRDARDLRCHFFGCLGIKKRVEVLNNADHPIWERAERLENEDTELHVRNPKSKSPGLNQMDDDGDQLDMRYITALNLQAELKRIKVLRKTPALRSLVRELGDTIDEWREENQSNIKMVHERRTDTQKWDYIATPTPTPRNARRSSSQALTGPSRASRSRPSRQTTTPVDPEVSRKELKKNLEEFSQTLKDIIRLKRNKNTKREPNDDPEAGEGSEASEESELDSEPDTDSDQPVVYDLRRDIKARLIKVKRPDASDPDASSFMANIMGPLEENVANKIFKGSFPDQQVSVYHLLNGKFRRHKRHMDVDAAGKSPTVSRARLNELKAEKACPSELRYYHIPANNMSWVEQAIATYFKEPTPRPEGNFELCPQTRLVLQDGCWRGQEHNGGPGSVVHTRNLRPICEKIPTDLEDLKRSGESTQKGLVLFMPYLHWETDRRRHQVANLIEKLVDEHDLEKRETAKMWKVKRKNDRKGLDLANLPENETPAYQEPNYYRLRSKNRETILTGLAKMLWVELRTNQNDDVPPGLPHALWQSIRDEDYENELLVALRIVVRDIPGPARLPFEPNSPAIQSIFYEDLETTPRLRDWRDILWGIKAAARGNPTPHALEDIFWEKIKRTRKLVDDKSKSEPSGPEERHHLRTSIFQKDSTILKGVEVNEYGLLQPVKILAQILVRAARLYEQITTYPDQKLMEEYLFKYPPLHPRRTLDQAYFWRLRDTRLRDRDQVVYRYTNAQFAHKIRPQPPSDIKNDRSRSSMTTGSIITQGPSKSKAKREDWVWTRHGQFEKDEGCEQCDEDIRKVSRAIMVDQLWIWVLDKDTILTCFPQRYGMYDNMDPSGVHQSVRMRVKTRSNPDNHIRSIFDLALIILDESFDTFFSRARTADKRPQVMDMFAESIGRVTNKQAIAFKHLWQLSERLTGIYQSGVEDKVDPALILALLNVTPEAELQREIRDIIDELDIILHIAKQQNDMITRFVKLASQIVDADVDKYTKDVDAQTTHKVPHGDLGRSSSQKEKEEQQLLAHNATLKLLLQQQSAFKSHSEDLLSEIKDRIEELSGLKKSAESTAQNVNDLLGLKQQQASVVQAYEAMKQGEETVRQGKAIMVFTVMTIIFLPLSFMSSLFGMNAVELTGNDPNPGAGSSSSANSSAGSSGAVPDEIVPFYPTTFKRQVLVMFTVSFGAVLLVIIPAFSPFIRAFYSSMFNQSVAKIITWSGMYKLWLKSGLKSKDVRDHGRANVSKMKKNVREALARQTLQNSEIWDGVRITKTKKVESDGEQPSEANNDREVANGGPPLKKANSRVVKDLEKGSYS